MKILKSYIKFIVTLIILIFVYKQCVVITTPDEYNLIKQFGAVVGYTSSPGPTLKIPFIQSVQSVPRVKLIYDLEPSIVNTSDKKMMVVDSFAIWQITDPLLYLQSVGANQTNAEQRISNAVYNSVKTVISSTTQEDVINGRSGALVGQITDKLDDTFVDSGFEILKVETKMLDLTEDNKQSVYSRMISERNSVSASYISQGDSQKKKIYNETDKNVQIKLSEAEAQAAMLVAEGEAEYMKILSEAYNDSDKADFYNFIRSLDALKTTLKGENKTIILDGDSDLARILNGVN